MGPLSRNRMGLDPDEKHRPIVWFSPCCNAVMGEDEPTCPLCKEPVVPEPEEDDQRGEEW